MGMQQILLVFLTIILVGIAITAGIQMQHGMEVNNHRQIMITGMNELLYGESNYWNNTYNARIVAVFDNTGKLDENGFQYSQNW